MKYKKRNSGQKQIKSEEEEKIAYAHIVFVDEQDKIHIFF